ncbi:MAG: hypothetical protein Q7V57_11205 [Actinomycetota bacterium]|nr:hypothetical protein [Actinomycetota bacterium]
MKKSDGFVREVDTVRYHTTRVVVRPHGSGKARALAIEVMLSRVAKLMAQASSVSARADGFSKNTPLNGSPGGGKGGGRLMRIEESDGVDLVPTSSTEVAAIDARRAYDPVAALGVEVSRRVGVVARELDAVERALDRFDELQNRDRQADPPMCWVAAKMHNLPFDFEWEPWRLTDFAGQLDEPFDEARKVCKYVYWFVRDHKRLPTRAEMVKYLEKQTERMMQR